MDTFILILRKLKFNIWMKINFFFIYINYKSMELWNFNENQPFFFLLWLLMNINLLIDHMAKYKVYFVLGSNISVNITPFIRYSILEGPDRAVGATVREQHNIRKTHPNPGDTTIVTQATGRRVTAADEAGNTGTRPDHDQPS